VSRREELAGLVADLMAGPLGVLLEGQQDRQAAQLLHIEDAAASLATLADAAQRSCHALEVFALAAAAGMAAGDNRAQLRDAVQAGAAGILAQWERDSQ
jgi:hypothetical protein